MAQDKGTSIIIYKSVFINLQSVPGGSSWAWILGRTRMVSNAFPCFGGDGRSGWGLGGAIWMEAEGRGESTLKLELAVWTCNG